MVGRVGRFKRDDVPKILGAYNAEMTERGVNEAMRLDFFYLVADVSTHKEVKELHEAHESWESFERALFEAYGYAKPEGRGWHEFDRWVASARCHQSVMKAF